MALRLASRRAWRPHRPPAPNVQSFLDGLGVVLRSVLANEAPPHGQLEDLNTRLQAELDEILGRR